MSFQSLNSTTAADLVLARQRRNTTISSLLIALLMMALILVILAIIFTAIKEEEIPTIVSYTAASVDEEVIEKPVQKTSVSRKPSAPSSSMARVIASNTTSPTAIPVPEFETPESLDFGNGEDFGDGWGDEDWGDGGGSTTFFGQKVSAERIAYVIDYSLSMKSENREKLMRDELKDSLEKMLPGKKLGMIFFAGPAWAAGGTANNKGIVKSQGGRTYKWVKKGQSHGSWEHDGKKEKVPWITITDAQVRKYQKIVKKTPLVIGTVWDNPLHMALDMDPKPQMIYFMTDGAAGGSDVWAKDVAKRAKEMGVTINTVAMMVPRAINDLKYLAHETGGMMTIVNPGGKRELVQKNGKRVPLEEEK